MLDRRLDVPSVEVMEMKLNDVNETVLTNEMIIDLDISGVMFDVSDSDGCGKMFHGDVTINKEHTNPDGKSSSIALRYDCLGAFTEDIDRLHEESLY